jgi:hypothetical protein
MQVEMLTSLSTSVNIVSKRSLPKAHIVFYFMSPDYPDKAAYVSELKNAYPAARIMGCTTGGEIAGNEALSGAAVSAAIALEHSTFKIAHTHVDTVTESYDAGARLAKELDTPALRMIFILSDGLQVNGSELVRGITENAHPGVVLTGGLAGDGPNFKQTGVGIDGALPESGKIVAVGLYGDKLQVSYGSVGGWAKFGPERLITKSKDNVLYELDGKPALDLYKKYLGEEAKNLPGSGLLFPLSIYPPTDSAHDIVRTIVGVNEKTKSLTFAGDVPQGYTAQLMRGNTESVTAGAVDAAQFALKEFGAHNSANSLGILVSCIGRNLLMGQNVSNEVEAVKDVLGNISLVGFYSYGEICHHPLTRKCGLHNQTMTITLLSEAV